MKGGESKYAALTLMKNSHFDRTLQYQELKIFLVGDNVSLLVQLPFLLIRFQMDWSAIDSSVCFLSHVANDKFYFQGHLQKKRTLNM